jgi:hypothetical protein
LTIANSHYALVKVESDGLLLDLVSGNLFHLNESAVFVWERSLRGELSAAISEALVNRYGVPLATAQQHVAAALDLDDATAETIVPTGQYSYRRSRSGYSLLRDGVSLLAIDEYGASVALARAGSVSSTELPAVLQGVAPKVMSLRSHVVIHAAAVVLGNGIVAFSGKSGAGKTTTAKALARAGSDLICVDKMVVRRVGEKTEGFIAGEAAIMEWVAEAAALLVQGKEAGCDQLDRAAVGAAMPINAIGFLDAARRAGTAITPRPLSRAETTRALFANSFFGSAVADDWAKRLDATAAMARAINGYDMTVPDGLLHLEAAARTVVERQSLVQTDITAS